MSAMARLEQILRENSSADTYDEDKAMLTDYLNGKIQPNELPKDLLHMVYDWENKLRI